MHPGTPVWAPGDEAQLHGLSKEEMNGRIVRLVDWLPQRERWKVEWSEEGVAEEEETKDALVKPVNLIPVSTAPLPASEPADTKLKSEVSPLEPTVSLNGSVCGSLSLSDSGPPPPSQVDGYPNIAGGVNLLGTITFADGMKHVTEQFSQNAPAVQMTSIEVNLVDRESQTPLRVPCRGRHCAHVECFELSRFFRHNINTDRVECPVCGLATETSEVSYVLDAAVMG